MNKSRSILIETLKKGGEISPFLFYSQNLEILQADLEISLSEIKSEFGIDEQSIFRLSDTGESLKIDELKSFIQKSEIKPRFDFQIFYIEHLSRMTLQAQNACLKFFEEPGLGNIIICTNPSSSDILETLLSRVQEISLFQNYTFQKNIFFESLIESHISKESSELVQYFFSAKLEKKEYLEFLQTLLFYLIGKGNNFDMVDDLQEDISGVLKNNLQARYIVDKYIILLS